MVNCQVAVFRINIGGAKDRPGNFGQRMRRNNQRLRWGPQSGSTIIRIKIRRLRSRLMPLEGVDRIRWSATSIFSSPTVFGVFDLFHHRIQQSRRFSAAFRAETSTHRQADIVFRKGLGRGTRTRQVIEIGELPAHFESVVTWKTMQHSRHPQRKALHQPHSLQTFF